MMPEGKVSLPGAPSQISNLPLDTDLLAKPLPDGKKIETRGEDQHDGLIEAQSSDISSRNSAPFSILNEIPARRCRYPSAISNQYCCG